MRFNEAGWHEVPLICINGQLIISDPLKNHHGILQRHSEGVLTGACLNFGTRHTLER